MIAAFLLAVALQATPAPVHPMVVVREAEVRVRQSPPPHDGVGESTAYRLSDAAPRRNFDFRKRILHSGASIGLHRLGHDEVYYVVSGRGVVESDGETREIGPETAAYLYEGAVVGIRQTGDDDLTLIIAYPLAGRVAEDGSRPADRSGSDQPLMGSQSVAVQPSLPAATPPTYGSPISLDAAQALLSAARELAARRGFRMAFAVVEPSGELVAFSRMDDTQYGSIHVAQRKAETAARYRSSTSSLEARTLAGRTVTLANSDVLPIAGGVPIVVDGRIIGALGVSGASAAEDEEIARASLGL